MQHHRRRRVEDHRELDRLMHDNWTYLKDPVHQRWNLLDDVSLDEIDGDHERLLDRLQVAYGIHRDQAESELEAFLDDYEDYFELVGERSPGTPIAPRPSL